MAKEVEIIVKATDKASQTFDKIWKSSDSFSDKIKKNLTAIKVASWIATTALIAMWKKMLDSAKAIEPVRNSFDRLAKDIDQDSDKILASLKKASKWTISDYNLMLSANKAMSLWVAKNTDEFSTLMEIARVKGQAMWLTMEQAFSDIVTGLWRSSPMILDNLWITIKLWEAQEMYAKKLWKTVEQMTDAEKKQALINAVVTQGKEELKSAGEVALTTAERQAQLQASFQNLSATLWTALIPAFEKVMEIISPIVEKVSAWITENPKLAWNLFIVATAVAWVTFAVSMLAPAIWTVVALLSWPLWFIALVWLLFVWLNALEGVIVSTDEKIAWYNAQIASLTEQYNLWAISQEEYKLKLAELQAQITTAETQSKTLWQTLRDDLDATLKMMLSPIESAKEAFRNFWIIVDAIGGAFDRLAEKIWGFILWKIQAFIDKIKQAVAVAKSIMWALGVWWDWNIVSNTLDKVTWRRASWWPVSSTWSYLVGEKWPEMFVPNTNWTIVPNDQMWSSQTVNINMGGVVVNDQADENRLVQKISDALKRQNQLYSLGIN